LAGAAGFGVGAGVVGLGYGGYKLGIYLFGGNKTATAPGSGSPTLPVQNYKDVPDFNTHLGVLETAMTAMIAKANTPDIAEMAKNPVRFKFFKEFKEQIMPVSDKAKATEKIVIGKLKVHVEAVKDKPAADAITADSFTHANVAQLDGFITQPASGGAPVPVGPVTSMKEFSTKSVIGKKIHELADIFDNRIMPNESFSADPAKVKAACVTLADATHKPQIDTFKGKVTALPTTAPEFTAQRDVLMKDPIYISFYDAGHRADCILKMDKAMTDFLDLMNQIPAGAAVTTAIIDALTDATRPAAVTAAVTGCWMEYEKEALTTLNVPAPP